MKEESFTSDKTGKLVWVSNGMYYRFEPKKLPLSYTPSLKVLQQQTKTALALGELKGAVQKKFSEREIFFMQFPFIVKEAQLSSQIEGTRSTITDVYKSEKIEEKDPEKRLDNEEVNNYRAALNFALNNPEFKITEDSIKELHRILLKGVRGMTKTPGKYKTDQNAVGSRDDSFDTAKFVPAPPEKIEDLMKNLIGFINSDIEPLYKIAIAHYQFETIHPFRDGNGRIGRLLIILQMCKDNILRHPLLYISEYFNRNRDTYTDRLFDVSSKGDIESWVLFFLKALEFQATQSLNLLNKLLDYKSGLHEQMKNSKTHRIHMLIDSLFKEPFVSINDVVKILDIKQPSAWHLVKKLREASILEEYDVIGNEKLYYAPQIIKIIEGKD